MKAAAVPVQCRSHSSFQVAFEEVRRLSQNGITVQIRDLNELEPREALELLEFFLHDRTAKGPLEPFATLLAAAMNKEAIAIWDLVPPQDMAPESPGVREAFLRNLPEAFPDCMFCGSFPLCVGYGAWSHSCETWKAVCAQVGGAARELRRLRRS